jgi:hypothetical protein
VNLCGIVFLSTPCYIVSYVVRLWSQGRKHESTEYEQHNSQYKAPQCYAVFLQYAFLVTSVLQFAGGVVVFFGLLTSPKEVGEYWVHTCSVSLIDLVLSPYHCIVLYFFSHFKLRVQLVVCTGYAWYTPSNEMLTCRILLKNATRIRNNTRYKIRIRT